MGSGGRRKGFRVQSESSDIFHMVRELRGKHGLTQAELASMAGISLPALQRFEAGNRSAQLNTINRILTVLGCELTVRIKKTAPESSHAR